MGLTGATIASPTAPVACPAVTLEPGQSSAAGCSASVASTPDDFEQGGMWLNVTAEATSRANTAAAAITAHAEHYQTLVQLRKLAASFVAEPGSISSAGKRGLHRTSTTSTQRLGLGVQNGAMQ